MYRNPNKTPSYPCHDCSQRSINTDVNLVRSGRSNSNDCCRMRSSSDNKLDRSPNRSKTRYMGYNNYLKDHETLINKKLDDIVLVNITDQHTTCQQKSKKMGKKCQKKYKLTMKTGCNVKENSPAKKPVPTCSHKTGGTELIKQRRVEEMRKSALAPEEDLIRNALRLTNQIKTNIDSIRAQSNKGSSLQGVPQSKYVFTSSKQKIDFPPNTAIITAPYLQQLKNEINANRNASNIRNYSAHADQDIINLRNEILQYKLKSEQDLPQGMVIEVSYEGKDKPSKTLRCGKKGPSAACEVTCDKYTECRHDCQFTLTNYSEISEKSVINKSPRTKVVVQSKVEDEKVKVEEEAQPAAVVAHISVKNKIGGKDKSKKSSPPATEDGDSTGHAFDDLEPDTFTSTAEEEVEVEVEDADTPSFNEFEIEAAAINYDTHFNTFRNERMSINDDASEIQSLLNESFLRDQIVGMKKIDKLVEEAEQSISKVVKGFDKYFKEPGKHSHYSVESSEKKRDIKFDIDETCDCAQSVRCDCETKECSEQDSFLSVVSEAPTSEPPTDDTDYLNTISERTETANTGNMTPGASETELNSVDNAELPPVEVIDTKKTRRISMETRNIVHIPPLKTPAEKAPVLQEAATETDYNIPRVKVAALEIQNIPGVEILSSLTVQQIYRISIDPTVAAPDEDPVKNNILIEVEHSNHFGEMGGKDGLTSISQVETNANEIVTKEPARELDEIKVIKAPAPKSKHSKHAHRSCKRCVGTQNNERTIDALLNDIRAFQIPMIMEPARDFSSDDVNSISDSEYVVVQDNETQVSGKPGTPLSPSHGKSCNRNTCVDRLPIKTQPFPVNVQLPIPGVPIDVYRPLPYDNEEILEVEITPEPLHEPDLLSPKVVEEIIEPPQVNEHFQLEESRASCDFTAESCSMSTLGPTEKIPPDFNDILCLQLGYDCLVIPEENLQPDEEMPKERRRSSVSEQRPVSFAAKDLEYDISNYNIGITLEATAMDIEGMQIMDPTYEYAKVQKVHPAPHKSDQDPDSEPAQTKPAYTNTTAMPVMVQYDQQGVNQSLAQNLLLAQLGENMPILTYHKHPVMRYYDSTSSESSRSSGDYPERNTYLMRAKRRNLTYQRGIITEEDDVVLRKSQHTKDSLSDGEMSQYTSSTGELVPFGPRLLRNTNFMRRRPDKIFQQELRQRNMHIQRQYNYFNNMVSYYVADN